MKREWYRKCKECNECAFHHPEGPRQNSLDPNATWKESCECSGYSFWPELTPIGQCFDFLTPEQWSKIKTGDRINEELWKSSLYSNNEKRRKKQPCCDCAFFLWNGHGACRTDLEFGKECKDSWMTRWKCPGYYFDAEKDPEYGCSSFLTVGQWASIIESSMQDRLGLWEQCKAENIRKFKKLVAGSKE